MSLWKNRNFVILFSGQMISGLGDSLYGIALLWYVLALTHSKTDLAITGFGTTLPPLLGLIVGVWIDRWQEKAVMIVSDIVRALLLFSLFLLTHSGHPSFWVVLALIILVEAMGTFFEPAASAFLPRIVPRDQYASASGLQQSAGALASLSGTLGGGALMGLIGAPLLFFLNAMSFLISVLSLPFVRPVESSTTRATLPPASVDYTSADTQDWDALSAKSTKVRTSVLQEWRNGWKLILKSRYLTQSGISSAVANFSLAGTGILLTAWSREALHGTAFTLSALMTGLLVGMIVGGITVGWVHQFVPYRWMIPATLMGLGVGITAVGLWPNLAWDIASMFLSGLMLGWVDGAGGAIHMMVVPEEARGRVFSTLRALGRIAMPLGTAILGALMIYVPLWIALVLSGVGPILSGMSYLMPYSKATFDEIEEYTRTGA